MAEPEIQGFSTNNRRGIYLAAAVAVGIVILHALTNGRYGFHRDELAFLDDARHLAWGYVAYPPFTPFVGRIALAMWGPSLVGLRCLAALAIALATLLTALMARELGARPHGQMLAALAAATAPVTLAAGALYQYVAFDYLWWVLTAYCTVRLLKSDDGRWWIAIGASLGCGLLTKYTIGFLALGLATGVLLSPARRFLRSRWLWLGAAATLVLFSPNLVWQARHDFISLDFLRSIHERDIRIGRTGAFVPEQFYVASNLWSVPLWIAGLVSYFRNPEKHLRVLGWMFVVPLALFLIARGRGYYMAPAYPLLLAGGVVAFERWLAGWSRTGRRWARDTAWCGIAIGGILGAAIALPLAPVNSRWFRVVSKIDADFKEEIGWPELAQTVSRVYRSLPEDERGSTGILAGNYGEAGALSLYGPRLGLPRAISGINSYWFRGYGDPPPRTLIVLGHGRDFLDQNFSSCSFAAAVTNQFGVENEETQRYPGIFVCRGLRTPWPEFWKRNRHFG